MFKFLWPCFIEMVQFSCVTLNSGCSYEPLEKILHLCKISTLSAMASMKHSIITFLHSFVEYLWHSYTVLYGHNLKWCLNDKASWYWVGNPSKRKVLYGHCLDGGFKHNPSLGEKQYDYGGGGWKERANMSNIGHLQKIHAEKWCSTVTPGSCFSFKIGTLPIQ